jgi:hypothetical protein
MNGPVDASTSTMKIGWTAKRAIASVCLVAAYGALTIGCSANTDDTSTAPAETAPAGTKQARASAETKQAFGVDHWSSRESAGNAVVEGTDESGTVRVRFERTVTTDAAGDAHGAITANLDGAPMFQYVVSARGEGKVLRNDFPNSAHAVEAARAALADLGNAGGALVQTRSLETLDLVSPGGPPLVKGCVASLVAVACIVAASCGLGGGAGAEVLAAVAEAGTEQCR